MDEEERKVVKESELDKIKSLSEEQLIELLQRNYETLVDFMNLKDGLLTQLFSKLVISPRNKESVQSKPCGSEQNEMLLDILMKKEKQAIIKFFESLLDKDHQHVLQAVINEHAKYLRELSPEKTTRGEDKNPDIGRQLQGVLKDLYREEFAHVRCNPLDPEATQPIKKLYVNLSIVQEDINHAAAEEKKLITLEHYNEIFVDLSGKEEKKEIHRILIQGKPGVGKTTFTKRLAVDWEEGEEKQLSERFENVFVLTLRKVQPGQTLVEIISEQLLPYKSPLVQHLEAYIEQNNHKCLFVFDGLDEMKHNTSQDIDKMIQRNYLRQTCLLITSRPSQAQHLTTTTKIDQHARIDGFTEANVIGFIEKFYGESVTSSIDNWYWALGLPDDIPPVNTSTGLFTEIVTKRLLEIAKIPLILNILCLLYRTNKSLPKTIAKIYQRLQLLLCRRKKDEESEGEVEPEEILVKLGKIAFEGLLKENNQLFFSKKKILEQVGEEAFKVGLIWIEKAKYELELNTQAYFLHKSFQEYTAAFYLGRETDNNNDEPWNKLKAKMETHQDICELELFLSFCVWTTKTLAEKILNFLDEKAFESNPKLKIVLQSMDKLSQNKDLSTEELDTILNYDFDIEHDVLNILEWEAKCIRNIERPTEIRSRAVNKVIYGREFEMDTVNRTFLTGILELKSCIACIENDRELEDFVNSTNSVSWIKLRGRSQSPFLFTKNTMIFLQEMCEQNQHEMSVCIGEYCRADFTTMTAIVKLLKENVKVKYQQVTLNTEWHYNRSGIEQEDWEKMFQILLGIKFLIALDLCRCEIPLTVLATMRQILNADTLLQLDLSHTYAIDNTFCQEMMNPLSLTVLKLNWSASGTNAMSHLLNRCKQIAVLEVAGCKCEISGDILKLKNLKEIDISSTVNEETGEGLNVGQVLANLDKVELLEVLKAEWCRIDDAQIQNIPFNKPSKLIKMDLSHCIGNTGLQYLCENHKMLQELKEIRLWNNKIGDAGGQVLMEYVEQFKSLREIGLQGNKLSYGMKSQLEEKCKQSNIHFDG